MPPKPAKRKKSGVSFTPLQLLGGLMALCVAFTAAVYFRWGPEDFRQAGHAAVLAGNFDSAVSFYEAGRERAAGSNVQFLIMYAIDMEQSFSKGLYPEGATRAAALYREAIAAKTTRPQFIGKNNHLAVAHNNLCVILDREGNYHEAKKHCLAAIDVKNPDFFYPHTTLAKINEKFGLVDAARQQFEESNRLKPDAGNALHIVTILPLVYESMTDYNARHKTYVDGVARVLRENKLRFVDPLDQLVTVANFYLAFFGKNDMQTYKNLAQIMIQSCEGGHTPKSLTYVAQHALDYDQTLKATGSAPALNGRKIKVAFISMFFREHASGKMIQGIIKGLSKDKFHVTVFCIKEKGDVKPYGGDVADRIRNAADKYVELRKEYGLEQMRQAIEFEKIDVLIYAEIGMDPANYALSFARLAPIQVATHGHASTTGVPSLEYFVSYAPFELPEAQSHYSEKLVTFTDFSPYYKPDVPAEIPDKPALWASLGLTDIIAPDTVVYVCLQTLFKLVPDFDAVFRAILEKNPRARIIFKQFSTKELNDRLNRRLKHSIGAVVDRITILTGGVSHEDWFGLLRHAHVVLDSYPFGGYTTSLETFAAGGGTPIVTLPAELMAGRCTKGFYDIIGVPDCIATSRAHYIDLAVRIGTNDTLRADIAARTEQNAHKLWNRKATLPEWEQFLTEALLHKPIANLHVGKAHRNL